VLQIPYRQRLSVVAPKLLTKLSVDGRETLVVGADLSREVRLKRWWRIAGGRPSGPDDVLVGFDVARQLDLIAIKSVSDPAAHHAVAQEEITIRKPPST
jgi:putative ABC transport system permease protein